jgi:hypothetical protein
MGAAIMDRWSIGGAHDSRDNTVGITVHRCHDGIRSTRFMWPADATAKEIAAKLREAAAFLEPADDLPITEEIVKRETRWLRVAGHNYAASLIDHLWRERSRSVK